MLAHTLIVEIQVARRVILRPTQSRALPHAVRLVPQATFHQLTLRLVYHVTREATLRQEICRAQIVKRGNFHLLHHHLLALIVILANTQSRALRHAVRLVPRATFHQPPSVLRLVYHVPREATLQQEQRRALLVQRELRHLL